MHISKVTYQRVKNLGNYETERVEVEVALNEDENADKAFTAAKQYVNGKLDLGPTEQDVRDAYAVLRDAGMVEEDDSPGV
jgi:hypothetical protein